MRIFSDSIDTINTFIGEKSKVLTQFQQISKEITLLCKLLFKTKEIHQFKLNENKDWNYLFIVKEAEESQFDLLVALSSQLPDKIVCVAESGSGFHGFRNRTWDARKGNIHLSLFFKPQNNFPNFHAGLLIASAVSIIETIDKIPGLKNRAKTKWVNDVTIDGEKVCGIITQSSSTGNNLSGAIIGIGLNVLSKPIIVKDRFTPKATALVNLVDPELCKTDLILSNLLSSLRRNIDYLNVEDYPSLHNKYCERSAVIGKKASVYSDPVNGKSEELTNGKIVKIGKNLELYFENVYESVRNGRLAMLE